MGFRQYVHVIRQAPGPNRMSRTCVDTQNTSHHVTYATHAQKHCRCRCEVIGIDYNFVTAGGIYITCNKQTKNRRGKIKVKYAMVERWNLRSAKVRHITYGAFWLIHISVKELINVSCPHSRQQRFYLFTYRVE